MMSVQVEPSVNRIVATFQEVFQFAADGDTLLPATDRIDAVAAVLRRPKLNSVYLHGTAAGSNSSSPREALGTRRVQRLMDELVRRGVPRERLIEQNSREFAALRTDLSDDERRALLATAAVIVYGAPPTPTASRSNALCYPGVLVRIDFEPEEFSKHLDSRLRVRSCLGQRCGHVDIAIGSLWTGDEVIAGGTGELQTSATVTWKPARVTVLSRLVTERTALHNGAEFDFSIEANGQPLRRLRSQLDSNATSGYQDNCPTFEFSSP